MKLDQTDNLFRDHLPENGEFAFDENVARVFDDMISRSVPLYADVQRSIPELIRRLDHSPVKVVDLGCSTGTSLVHVARQLPGDDLELIGVDNSQAMLKRCRHKLELMELGDRIETVQSTIQDFRFDDASVVLMNYTLQFVDVKDRLQVLERVRNSLRKDGLMLLSEKVVSEEPDLNDAMVDLYFEFKRRQGYSDLEISRKRDALENVLVPLTVSENLKMLTAAGFGRVEVLLKWFNFATFLCRI